LNASTSIPVSGTSAVNVNRYLCVE
jgi:hypothetical protein